MLKRNCLLLLGSFTLSVLGFSGSSQGAPPPPPIPMRATFYSSSCDGTSCRVNGDGNDYINGADGVQCTINQGNGDFILDTRTRKGAARLITYDLSSVIPCPANLPSPNPCPDLCPVYPPYTSIPNTPLLSSAYLYVQNLLGIQPGTGRETVAIFVTDSVGTLVLSPIFNGGNCSTRVLVQRAADGNTWEICSTPLSNDIAVLLQNGRNGQLPVRYLHLPFHLTVSRLP
jgi:hypothetical protein